MMLKNRAANFSRKTFCFILFTLLPFFLLACNEQNRPQSSIEGSIHSDGAFSLLLAPSLISSCTQLTATVVMDGGSSKVMTVDCSALKVLAEIPDVSEGSHKFVLNYFITHPTFGDILVMTGSTTVNVVSGQNSAVVFTQDLLSFPDNDNDGVSNFDEVLSNSDPDDPDIKPVPTITAFTIVASAGLNGSISPSGSVVVNTGTNRTFTITPSLNHHVVDVKVDGVSRGARSSFTLTNVTAPHSISATFAINTTDITANAGPNGTISPSPTATVNHGTDQTFTITPDTGFKVLGVFVDNGATAVTTSAPDPTTGAVTFTFTGVTGPHSISATFVIKTYDISASAGVNGSISPSPTARVNHGTDQTFTITPTTGFDVLGVFVDGGLTAVTTSAPDPMTGAVTFTFTGVTGPHSISATFVIKTYDISASAGLNGSISPSGILTVNHGANQGFTISPAPNHQILNVIVDGVSRGTITSFTFTNVTAPHTISVTFARSVPLVAPVAEVLFPTQNGFTDAKTLTIRGRASDPDGITAVRVNGVTAITSDGFATWHALVPLNPGNNTFVIETEDPLGAIDSNAASIQIKRPSVVLNTPRDLALDLANNRVFVIDSILDALVSIHLTTGIHTIVSNASTGTGIDLISPFGLALDLANNRAYVTDLSQNALISINLATGDRTIVSNATTGTGIPFESPFDLALDLPNRAFVTDDTLDALFSVNLTTGNRTLVSNASTGTEAALIQPFGLALDLPNNFAYVADHFLKAIVSINLITGNHSIVSNASTGTGEAFSRPDDLALDLVKNLAYVTDVALGAIFSVNLTTGNRSIVSNATTGTGIALSNPDALVLDLANNRAFVIDVNLGALISVNLSTGDRTIVSNLSNSETGAGTAFSSPEDLGLDLANKRIFATDSSFADALVSVSLTTGNRTIVSNATTGTGTDFIFPIGLGLDLANNRALITDASLKALVSVNLATGNRTIVSNATTGTGTAFIFPFGLGLDLGNNRAFVTDDFLEALISVNLVTGNRTIISNATTGTGTAFSSPSHHALDLANNRAFVTDRFLEALVSVNLTTGNRTIVSNATTGTGTAFSAPSRIALDLPNNRAFVTDSFLRALISVNLTTGNRTIVSNAATGAGTAFSTPIALALDLANNLAFVSDFSLGALFIVDLENGNRVIVSK